MANYCSVTRSSYFYVTDEEKYKELMAHIITYEDSLKCWEEKKENGKIAHAFGCYSYILGYINDVVAWENYENDEDPDYDDFLQKLSEIIAPGSACVIMQSGNDKLRYVDGFVDIVMPGKVKCESLESITYDILKENGISSGSVEFFIKERNV